MGRGPRRRASSVAGSARRWRTRARDARIRHQSAGHRRPPESPQSVV